MVILFLGDIQIKWHQQITAGLVIPLYSSSGCQRSQEVHGAGTGELHFCLSAMKHSQLCVHASLKSTRSDNTIITKQSTIKLCAYLREHAVNIYCNLQHPYFLVQLPHKIISWHYFATHWNAQHLADTILNAFSWDNLYLFCFPFLWSLFPNV